MKQAASSVDHYENFPVASWLCPPALRPAVVAIYHFARTADDIADEGDAPAADRLADLAAFQADLTCAARGQAGSGRWPAVFGPLADAIARYRLPVSLLADLLSAFAQDVEKNRDAAGYADETELLDYCRRSANPVGRLLLHLYGVDDARSLGQSDAICTALQLINFWQDLSVDLPRGRYYLPEDARLAHGVATEDLRARRQTPEATRLIAAEVARARSLMHAGAPLARRLPGRAGWELRLVVQGGLRIAEKIEQMGFTTLTARPKLTRGDAPRLLWRALRM